jgi:Pectinacetylesterase
MTHGPLGSALLLALFVGCAPAPMRPALDASATNDAASSADSAASPDASAAPFITEALSCRFTNGVGMGSGNMQRHTIDLARFPDALCNDGTGAVLHFRPFRGAANRNKWVIALRGGGTCSSGDSCAARYCGCAPERSGRCPAVSAEDRTNFTADNMTNASPPTLVGDGIFLRDGAPSMPNPIEDYNQIRLQYCSSDSWAGTRRDVVVSATHPVTGAAIQYRVHFLGSRILDADIATLRQDGVAALVHPLNGGTTMPDLDEAEEVIFAGDSAGGGGVINNVDRLHASLRANNTRCSGATCPLRVRAIIDASVGPDRDRLDWSATAAGTYENYTRSVSANLDATLGHHGDESCVEWHRSRSPGSEVVCADSTHVLRNHVTTPFFVRMALADTLISNNYRSAGVRDPMLGPVTQAVFAQLLSRELPTFPMIPMRAEEGAAMTVAPGVFGPGCANHDTLFETDEVFGATVTPAGGAATRLFDVFEPWRANGTARAIVAQSTTESACPPNR